MIPRQLSTAILIASLLSAAGCNSSGSSSPIVANDSLFDTTLPVGNSSQNDELAPSSENDTPVNAPDLITGSAVSALRLDTGYPSLLLSLAGYQLENLAEDVRLIGDLATISAISSTALEDGTYSVEDQGRTVDLPVTRTLYACELGGELTLELAQITMNDLFYSRGSLFTQYIFDQCRLEAEQGEKILDGTLQTMVNDIAGRHFTIKGKQANWTAFSWVDGTGDTIVADAMLDINEFSSFNYEISRQVQISNYSKATDDMIIERVSDASFEQSSSINASQSEQEYAMNVQGRVVDQSGIGVLINTGTPYFRRELLRETASEAIPFTGQLTMNSDDGSELLLTATETGSESTELAVDVVYQDKNGQTSTQNAQKLVNLPFYGVPLIH